MTDAERLIELRKLLDGQGCVESMGCNAAQFCVCDAMQDALDIADSQVTLIQQQADRIAALEGALGGVAPGHISRTWVNEAGHYCMEIVPSDEFFNSAVLGETSSAEGRG